MPGLLRIFLLVILLSGALSLPGNAAALARQNPAELSAGEYWQLVQETQTAVLSLDGSPAEVAHSTLDPYRQRWGAVQRVLLESGETIQLDMFYLSDLLAAQEPDLDRIASELEQIQAEKDLRQHAADTQDRSALTRVLSQSEFQWRQESPNPIQEWIDRAVNRFLAFIGDLLGNRGVEAGLAVMRYALIALGAVLVLFAAVFGVRTLLRSMVTEAALDASEHEEANLTAEGALDRAAQRSGEGDYRSAVRYLYLSTLLLLEERSLLRYDRSKTNREYLRSISHLPQIAEILREVVDVFDRVWYGFQPLEDGEYTRYAQRVEELRRLK